MELHSTSHKSTQARLFCLHTQKKPHTKCWTQAKAAKDINTQGYCKKKKKNTILFYKTFNSWNLTKHFSMSAVSFFVSYCFRFKIWHFKFSHSFSVYVTHSHFFALHVISPYVHIIVYITPQPLLWQWRFLMASLQRNLKHLHLIVFSVWFVAGCNG